MCRVVRTRYYAPRDLFGFRPTSLVLTPHTLKLYGCMNMSPIPLPRFRSIHSSKVTGLIVGVAARSSAASRRPSRATSCSA